MNTPIPTPPKSRYWLKEDLVVAKPKPTGLKKPRFVPKPHLTTKIQDSLPVDIVTQLLTLGI